MRIVRSLSFLLIVCISLISFESGCTSSTIKSNSSQAKNNPLAANCQSCHRLPDPKSRTDSEWVITLEKHKKRLNLKEDQQVLLLNYLMRSN